MASRKMGVRADLSRWDNRATETLRRTAQGGFWRFFFAVAAHSGDSWLWIPALVPIIFMRQPPLSTWALIAQGGILLTAGLVFAIKLAVRRRRPPGEWGQIYRKTDPHSFPSGHAARAVLLALLALFFGPSWLGIALLCWAPLVALARVAMGVHYLSDVLAGALLGAVVAVTLRNAIPFLGELF